MIQVHKAERRKAKLRLLLTGPSGSGKTYTAIIVARGLVGPTGKILLIDTERGSGELYADLTNYDVAPLEPPYRTEHYIEAIKYAEENGYDAVILDSITHAWAGQGGLLEQVDTISGSGNKFTAWSSITPKHQAFLDSMLSSPIHVIATVRSKTEYVLIPDEKGKNKPEKRGLAPIQRDGVEYEFTLVLDMAPNHTAEASKDRTGLFDGEIFYPTEETGKQLADWLDKGSAPTPRSIPTPAPAPEAAPVPEPAKKQPEQTTKKVPSRVYGKSEVENIRKRYVENGWSQKAIDEANVDGMLWDAEAIDADWKKRAAVVKKPAAKPKAEPAKVEPKPEVPQHVCPKCGKPSMSGEDAAAWKRTCDAAGLTYDAAICKGCAQKVWADYLASGQNTDAETAPSKNDTPADTDSKQTKPTTTEPETAEPEFTCVKCGAKITKVQRDVSNLYLGRSYCKKCMDDTK